MAAATQEEPRKSDQKDLEWKAKNPDQHKSQEEDRRAKERKYAAQNQRDARYNPSGRGGQRVF